MAKELQAAKFSEIEKGCAETLMNYAVDALQEPDGRVRAEDVITALGAIAGERCIEAAGDYNPRDHNNRPGSMVFSDRVNELLLGNVTSDNIDEVPSNTAVGIIRDQVREGVGKTYKFPSVVQALQYLAGNIGNPDVKWGYVPLSIPEDHQPLHVPLRIAYESRKIVDQILAPIGADKLRAMQVAALALGKILCSVKDVLDSAVAFGLAFETLNGMAKMAPMTDRHMQSLVDKQSEG